MSFVEKLKKHAEHAIKKMADDNIDFDLFNDDFSKEIDWYPLKPGGANFQTHKIVKTEGMKYAVEKTAGYKVFCGIFILIGLAVFGFGVYGHLFNLRNTPGLGIGIAGLLFTVVGIVMLKFSDKNYIFNGSRSRIEMKNESPIQFSQVHAIQILSERIRSTSSSRSRRRHTYRSYELNLVLKDKRRINIMDHGNREALVQDANKISSLMNVPIWDGTF